MRRKSGRWLMHGNGAARGVETAIRWGNMAKRVGSDPSGRRGDQEWVKAVGSCRPTHDNDPEKQVSGSFGLQPVERLIASAAPMCNGRVPIATKTYRGPERKIPVSRETAGDRDRRPPTGSDR